MGEGGVALRMLDTIVVIPCYNEAERLDIDRFVRFVTGDPSCRLLLVDDGSLDDTRAVLEALAECDPQHLAVLALPQNQGKAEAVRLGVLAAMAQGAKYVGYWDADLATPLEGIGEFRQRLVGEQQLEVIFGARVRMLGRNIQRRPSRHLLGRAFATVASLTLGLGVYDTQCGAKLFRVSPRTERLFRQPFLTNWIFDVELMARMLSVWGSRQSIAAAMYEMPLDQWREVAGSKLKPRDFVKALFELVLIYRAYLAGSADAWESEVGASGFLEARSGQSDRPVNVSRNVDARPRQATLIPP